MESYEKRNNVELFFFSQGHGDVHLSTDILLGYVCLQLADSKLCQATEECPGVRISLL